jgi:hypothetical protein
VAARGYRSIHGPEGYTELKRLGFSRPQAMLRPWLLVPVISLDGQPVLYQLRPDTPHIDAKGRPVKYETPKGQAMRLDFATGQREMIGNPAIPLWVTEGIKKVDALRTHGVCAIGLLGVWTWRGRNDLGGTLALADWEEVVLNGRDVYIVFDSDVTTKIAVQQALNRFQRFLAQRGAKVTVVRLRPADDGSKVGVDDYLLAHTIDELRALAQVQSGDEDLAATVSTLPYPTTVKGLVWMRPTRDGDVATPLTNFTAKIIGDVIIDDGTDEKPRHFELEAVFNGRTHRFSIPAAQFSGLGWVPEHLGAQALVFPRQLLKDHAYCHSSLFRCDC